MADCFCNNSKNPIIHYDLFYLIKEGIYDEKVEGIKCIFSEVKNDLFSDVSLLKKYTTFISLRRYLV